MEPSGVESSRQSILVKLNRVESWSVMEWNQVGSGRVGSGQVESSRVERSRVEWSRQLTVDSSQVKSSHGVELSRVESTVDSSRF